MVVDVARNSGRISGAVDSLDGNKSMQVSRVQYKVNMTGEPYIQKSNALQRKQSLEDIDHS